MEHTFEIVIGCKHIIAHSDIQGDKLVPGDLYIAKRNTGWQLGKCKKVFLGPGERYVMSDPPGAIYSYDCHECFKVKEINVVGGCGSIVYEEDGYVCPYFSRNSAWTAEHGSHGPCGIDIQLETNRCIHALIELGID